MRTRSYKVLFLAVLFSTAFQITSCTKKDSTDLPNGWSSSELNEVSQWHFENVSSKMQTLASRGDNAKKEFSKCWAFKMAKEYSHSEYKKASSDLDEYIKKNNVVITTLDQSVELGQKYPFHQRMTDFAIECGNELKM